MKFADMEPICTDAADKPPQLAVVIDHDDYFAAECERNSRCNAKLQHPPTL